MFLNLYEKKAIYSKRLQLPWEMPHPVKTLGRTLFIFVLKHKSDDIDWSLIEFTWSRVNAVVSVATLASGFTSYQNLSEFFISSNCFSIKHRNVFPTEASADRLLCLKVKFAHVSTVASAIPPTNKSMSFTSAYDFFSNSIVFSHTVFFRSSNDLAKPNPHNSLYLLYDIFFSKWSLFLYRNSFINFQCVW